MHITRRICVISFCIFGVIFSGIGKTDSKTQVLFSDCVHQVYTTVTHLISSKYRVRSKTRSSWKPRRIFFRGFSLQVFHFALYPKPKTQKCKPQRFSLRHFDQTLRYFDQTPSFPFCTTLKMENSEMKTSEFSLRLFVQT